jgi:hypothetical protein
MSNPDNFSFLISKQVIDEAVKKDAIVLTCVDGYQTDVEALILRDMLWYARNNGVVVQFIPKEAA